MMAKPDEAHRMTDIELALLELRIAKLYKEAADELQGAIEEYFEKLEERDKHQQELLKAGKITEQQYIQWRMAQIGRGQRFEVLRDLIAERYSNANAVAIAYTNDATPGIYSLNRNYIAYTIERDVPDASFTMFDERTVRRLIKDSPELMPYYPPDKALKRGIDLAYGKRIISSTIISGILQGMDIPKLSKYLQERIETMEQASALRTTRTAVTAAQNAGRQDANIEAEKMGIKIKRIWIATLDNRTRHAHRKLDGKTTGVHEPFKSILGEIMFPGDPSAHPANIYNCRCTMASLPGSYDVRKLTRYAVNPQTGKSEKIKYMTFDEYEEYWRTEDPAAWELYMKKGKNLSRDRKQHKEYKAILGKLIPDRLEDFQQMKYTEPEHWRELITRKVQTVAVNEAECVTTPKKFTEYLLKPGAKHAEDFFEVGYTADNPLQLRYDIVRRFDMERAIDEKTKEDGAVTFNMYMTLGITKTRSFITGWIKDTPDSKPRIVTAFRKEEK